MPPRLSVEVMTGGKGHQGNIAGTLDGLAHLALMIGTIAGNTPRHDFPALGNEITQGPDFLVVDGQRLVGTKPATFAAGKAALERGATGGAGGFSIISHVHVSFE
jgi:hypothetical protein